MKLDWIKLTTKKVCFLNPLRIFGNLSQDNRKTEILPLVELIIVRWDWFFEYPIWTVFENNNRSQKRLYIKILLLGTTNFKNNFSSPNYFYTLAVVIYLLFTFYYFLLKSSFHLKQSYSWEICCLLKLVSVNGSGALPDCFLLSH